ncbi:zinc-responsive transcriptional regulator [Anoxybacillus sp. BCO1]|nr:zinc-responsive transcriptional regulator [Anoxybacillus sp. BCO1]
MLAHERSAIMKSAGSFHQFVLSRASGCIRKRTELFLKLILRGKRFGFSLDEIHEMISLFDNDRTGRKQLEKTIAYGEQKLKEVTERIEDLMQLKQEMESILADFRERLQKLEGIE